MQKHSNPRTFTNQLPEVQLPLPGIEPLPEPRHWFLVSLGQQVTKHRIPLSVAAVILFLFAVGQGTLATGATFGAALFLVNRSVDNRMGGQS